MSKVAKWIFPAAGGKDGIIGTAKAVVGIMTGNWGMIASGVAQVAGMGKKAQGQARQASVLQLTLGETPREAVLGQTCTGGSLVDVFNFGGQYKTDKVTRCVALADHAIDGIAGFYIDETYYPWVGEGLQAAFSNKLSFHFRNASPTGHAPPQHVMENGGWAATDRMVGITHIWIDWYVDEKVWPQGHPAIRFVLRGLRAYDPRFDPQFGYSGPNPQTWEDRSSHRFTRNAKVLRYAYTRGIYAEGHHGDPNYLLIGRGLTAEEAPAAAVIADANLCDEIVDGVPRYTVGGVISAAQPFIDVDGMFAAAMAGVIVQREGTVDVEAGQAKAVVVTITDDDLVVGEPVSFSRFLPDNDGGRINTVMGRYIEPALGYKDHSAPVRRSLEDIQADGGPREQTVSLPLVDEVKQADRIIEIQRLLGRLERRASIVLPPKFAGLEEGDWIAWQSQRRHGGATVRYRVETYRQPETWRMYLTLREIASSVFGVPDPIEDHVIPPPAPIPLDALSLLNVTAEAITLPGETSTLPAIRFRWTAPVDAAVLAIRAEVRRVGETEAAPTRTEDVNAGELVTTNGVGADIALEARLVPIGDPSRPVLPSSWVPISTGALIAGDVSPTAPTIAALNAEIAALEALQASETVIREEQYEGVTARLNASGQNLLKNPAALRGVADWTNGDNVISVTEQPSGMMFARFFGPGGSGDAYSFFYQDIPFDGPGQPVSWQSKLYVDGPVTALSYARALNASGVDVNPAGPSVWQIETTTSPADNYITASGVAPAGTKIIRVLWATKATGPGYVLFTRQKMEASTTPSAWTDEATTRELSASVSEHSLAIIDLETGAALAKFELVAEASGGKPARFRLVSSSLGGSAIALDADYIYLGPNTVTDTTTNTEQTTVGGRLRVTAKGAPFGVGGNLLEWWGPTGIALSDMTPANGYNGRMTTAPYVFDNMGPGFSARANSSRATGSRSGAGSVTTGAIVITPTGATATVEYRWWYISGDTSLVIGTTSGGASATWQTTLSALSSKSAVWGWSATMSGQSHTGIVEVLAQAL